MASSTATGIDDTQVSGARKGSPSATLRPPEQGLRCPRCDSPNTKFCYYNNYSLSQPRHFCKTCRRYWTKGGALRNVPVGGGCRKNKRTRSASASASSTSRLTLNPVDPITGAPDPAGRLNFLSGSSPLGTATAADFQLGMLPFPRLQSPSTNQYMPYGDLPSDAVATPLGGFNYPAVSAMGAYTYEMATAHGLNSSAAVGSTIASSIESLSFINQDLHWKLQQQRLASMFVGPGGGQDAHHKEGGAPPHSGAFLVGQHPRGSISLQMVGSSKEQEDGCVSSTGGPRKGCFNAAVEATDTMPAAWFLESSFTLPSLAASAAAVATTSNSNNNIKSGASSGGGGDENNNINDSSNWSGAIPAWSDMPTFATLP